MTESEHKSVLEIIADQMKTSVVYLLAAAALLSLVIGVFPKGIAILGVLIVNASIGFWMEWQAQKSMQMQKEKDKISSKVVRDGEEQGIDAEKLVPGDVAMWSFSVRGMWHPPQPPPRKSVQKTHLGSSSAWQPSCRYRAGLRAVHILKNGEGLARHGRVRYAHRRRCGSPISKPTTP